MPTFQVELDDGRAFEVEADQPPSVEDVHSALGLRPGPIQNLNPTGDVDEANYKQMLGVSQEAQPHPSFGQYLSRLIGIGYKAEIPGTQISLENAATIAPFSHEAWTGEKPQNWVQGLQEGIAKQITIPNVIMLPLLARGLLSDAASPLVKAVIGGYFAKQGAEITGQQAEVVSRPEELGHLTPGERTEAGVNVATGVGMMGAPFAALIRPRTIKSGLTGKDIQSTTPNLDPELFGLPADRPQLAENVYQPATPTQPIGGAGFTVDAAGRVVRKADLTEAELRELTRMQGSGEYVQREGQVRPAQATPPIVGEQPHIIMRRAAQVEEGGIRPAYQAAGEPKQGGQVSFEAPAAAGGVPSARQAAISPEAFGGAEQPPDVIAKVVDVINNNDRLDLERRLAAFQAEPGAGVALASRNDLIRLTQARLQELATGQLNPELNTLRRIVEPKARKPLAEAVVTPIEQLRRGPKPLVNVAEAFERAQQAKSYFPRTSEALGMGEPSMPPTVGDVRLQREREKGQEATLANDPSIKDQTFGYRLRLQDPTLVDKAVPLRGTSNTALAVPLGGSRVSGDINSIFSTEEEALKALEQLKAKQGFDSVRLYQNPNGTYGLQWGKDLGPYQENSYGYYKGPKEQQILDLGEEYGNRAPNADVSDLVKQAQELRQQEVQNAPNIRGNQGQVPEKGLPLETGEKARSDDLQQSARGEERPGAQGVRQGAQEERIVAAVVRTPDGKIYTGPTHSQAYAKSGQALDQYGTIPDEVASTEFVTSSGRIVSSEEASQIGKASGQVAKGLEQKGVTSEDITGVGKVAEPAQGIGGGIQKAVEKNKEAGSVRFPVLDEEFWGKLGLKSGDAQQFYNRIRNQLGEGSAAWEMVKDVLPKTGRVTQEEVRKAVEEKGQKVEVHTYGMEGNVSEARREYDKMTHEWFETLPLEITQDVRASHGNWTWMPNENTRPEFRTKEFKDKIWKYQDLERQVKAEGSFEGPRATSAYSTVSAFPTSEPMPEWTKTKEKSNVQRVDVVIPPDWSKIKPWEKEAGATPAIKWPPDNLHENLPNTLGWAMIQYKTGPNGEKMAVVAEAQSRWGKNLRESQKAKDKYQKLLQRQTELEQQLDAAKTPQESGRINDEIRALQAERPGYSEIPDHPLLRDYNRLIVKAAIRQAKEEGATHIVLPDAETAMMSEGQDLTAGSRDLQYNGESPDHVREAVMRDHPEVTITDIIKNTDRSDRYNQYTVSVEGLKPSQEPGMRLNYDTILPRIAEELTGQKGEKVSLGEHKNAYPDTRKGNVETEGNYVQTQDGQLHGPFNTFEEANSKAKELGGSTVTKIKPRENLIFRNPDGTPKTDVSGLSYPLDKTRETFSLTGKDKPLSTTANAPSAKGLGASIRNVPSGSEEGAISLQPLKDVWDKTARFVKAGANKERISQLIDAADNAARLFAREQGNRLRVGLKSKQDRIALWAVVEAGGDPKKLQTFLSQVKGTKYEQQVRYAIAHQARLQPYADALGKQMEGQRNRELASGINTDEVPDYIKHAYDLERPGVFWDTGKGGGGLSTSFKKQRTFDTYASAIKAGFKPKNLDAADLVESRIAAGMKMVNRVKWGEQLRALKDPTDKMPLVESMVKQPKGTMVAPRGYSPRELLPGVRIAIKDGYGDIFDALTGDSVIQKHWAGRAALSTEGVIKHGLLLFDSFHASRMLQKESFMTGQTRVKRAQSLLEYDQPTINRLVASGDLPPETGAWYTKNRPTYDKLVANGLNIGRIGDALYAQVIRKELKVMGIDVNLPGRFNKWVFDKVTRSAMTEVALSEFERAKSNNPKWTDEQTAAYIAKRTNIYFGNLMRQGIFKSATARDALQLAFLAPQWVEGLVQSEVRAAMEVGQIPIDLVQGKALQVGSLAKGVGTGLLAYMIGTQIINQFTRGKFTWQNPEKDHKLDAWIPDPTGKTPGWFLSPMSVAAEVAHDFVRYSFKGKDPVEVASQIIGNKASPLARAVTTEFTGRDYSGTKILGGHFEREKQAGKALLPIMLPASGFTSEIPGQVGKQLMASGGLKVEQASAREEKAIQSSGMTIRERSRAEKKEVKPPTTLGQRFSIAQKSTEHNFERQQLLTDKLSKKSQAFLDQHALQLRGYEAEYSNEGTKTRLSAEEDDKMREFVAQRYDAAIDKLSRRGDWATANQKRKQVLLDAGLKAAREKSDRDYRNWYKSRFASPVQK